MKQLIINADDLGLSDGVSCGILKAIRSGAATSASALVNLPTSDRGLRLIHEHTSALIGLQLNFILGAPVSNDPAIGSLLDENGGFLAANETNTHIDQHALLIEGDAQIQRFKEITGTVPQQLSMYGYASQPFAQVLYQLAQQNQIHASYFFMGTSQSPAEWHTTSLPAPDTIVPLFQHGIHRSEFTKDHLNLNDLPENIIELHLHPGYVDQFLLDHSQLTLARCRDLATLIDPHLQDWLHKHYQLVDYQILKTH
ncbi:ChbG/HpnK family deacetylase [Lactobacillus selangorensis]|nr:ChbG/HpnK family deacetylase [Lactobacillus selangorensis]